MNHILTERAVPGPGQTWAAGRAACLAQRSGPGPGAADHSTNKPTPPHAPPPAKARPRVKASCGPRSARPERRTRGRRPWPLPGNGRRSLRLHGSSPVVASRTPSVHVQSAPRPSSRALPLTARTCQAMLESAARPHRRALGVRSAITALAVPASLSLPRGHGHACVDCVATPSAAACSR